MLWQRRRGGRQTGANKNIEIETDLRRICVPILYVSFGTWRVRVVIPGSEQETARDP